MNDGIAIIGLSGRFPGAPNIRKFWDNLVSGVESIRFFTPEEMQAAGVDPSIHRHKDHVNAGGALDGIEQFDAHFFGLNARDAEIMDPQHRLFLQCAWECLEDGGYNPHAFPGAIGVYAGASMSSYAFAIYAAADQLPHIDPMQVMILNDKDHLATHVSYKLNLRGPSMAVQTACSTSLVAICTACDALWAGRCDMALAGGAAISVPQRRGYLYQSGGILSPDGHCRPFDALARGTVAGSGVGVVLLKPADRAIRDGDHIYAIIRGAAVNNDGNLKVGYTAPSVEGQAQVIAMAQNRAGVPSDSIGYIEAHGTATQLGDPIEVAALTQAFRRTTQRRGFCALGSVKGNIGHLDAAAGVAGLIKATLAVHSGAIPATLHFKQSNPEIDFESSPFYVNAAVSQWPQQSHPRRAGVSSFGIGGTNAHCILEQPPLRPPSGPSRPHQILVASARSENALRTQLSQIAQHLRTHPEIPLPDAAFVLQSGREGFPWRCAIPLPPHASTSHALAAFESELRQSQFSTHTPSSPPPIVFLFPGQGTQHIQMAKDLYLSEPTFKHHFDLCAESLQPHLGLPLADIVFPSPDHASTASQKLLRTALAQPALFCVEYALAQLWMSWGILPDAMLGHSIGEYVAACLASVMSLPDALALVAARGALMDSMPPGAMLATPLSEAEALSFLDSRSLSLASINGPASCVLSGPTDEIDRVEKQLATRGLPCRRLVTSHAFHSAMMDPIVPAFIDRVRRITLSPPSLPFISNVTGTWITPEQATNPEYWGLHLRSPVRFHQGAKTLLEETAAAFLETGAGHTLLSLLKMQPAAAGRLLVPSLRAIQDSQRSDAAALADALATLWRHGASVDWSAYSSHEHRNRYPLPTYPFEVQTYWIGAPDSPTQNHNRRPLDDWFYTPTWTPHPAPDSPSSFSSPQPTWILVGDPSPLLTALARDLQTLGAHCRQRISFLELTDEDLQSADHLVSFALWGPGNRDDAAFWPLIELAQRFGRLNRQTPISLSLVASRLAPIDPATPIAPGRALCIGPARVIPQEFENVSCRILDLQEMDDADSLASQLLQELARPSSDLLIASRPGIRWIQSHEPSPLPPTHASHPILPNGAVCLITGGFGGIGFTLAQHLAQTVKARLILLGRTPPSPEKLQILKELESTGAQVWATTADVTNRDEIQAVVQQANQRFGPIDAVIHCAGIAGGGMIQLKTREAASAVLAPKVQGARILHEALAGQPLKFFAICSSLASVYGGFGQVDYCAANNFLDAFAQSASTPNLPVLSIQWDTWNEVGMAVNTQVPSELESDRQESLRRGITPAEGSQAFDRILLARLPCTAVCTTDLHASLTQTARPNPTQTTPTPPPRSAAAHPRPALATPLVSPRSDTEQKLSELWQELLGVAPVGIHDNFFQLGGHSLLAVQMISQLRARFSAEMTVQKLFDLPTVAQLAEHVDTSASDFTDLDAMARLLDQVEQLSESELQALLNRDGSKEPSP